MGGRRKEPPIAAQHTSEVEAHLRRQGARRDVVGSAKCGKEVVKRHFVGHIDSRQTQAPFVAVRAKQVVISQAEIKQIAGGDSRWIVIVVRSSGCLNLHQR